MTEISASFDSIRLQGRHIRLEPLSPLHAEGLLAAAHGADPALYRYSLVPTTSAQIERYIDSALAERSAGLSVPFAHVRQADGVILGSTRFFLLERWAWPMHHARYGNPAPDACEIGYTWLSASAIRTAANTEAKRLMLTFAFETWRVVRVCLHTDARNERSRNAILRIGGHFEGLLRAHRMAADYTPRLSARYSILESEWPLVDARLTGMVAQHDASVRPS